MSASSVRSGGFCAARLIPGRRVLGARDTTVTLRHSNRQLERRRQRFARNPIVASSISRSPSSSTTSSTPLPGSPPPGFSAPDATSFRLAVLGDLHYDPRDAEAFDAAKEQLARVLREKAEEGKSGKKVVSRLVQLGDLGASSFAPGTPECFRHAREFLGAASLEGEGGSESPFAPPALVVGNHDLEGTTFDGIGLRFSGSPALSPEPVVVSSYSGDSSDEEDDENLSFGDNARTRPYPSAVAAAEAADAANLDAWRAAFRQHHHWRAELGRVVLLGVSTTRFRSNSNSVHEVHVDGDQFRWLEDNVKNAEEQNRPVVIFTHAPPAGCGLRVVQAVHVRNRCAYLNHGALDREEDEDSTSSPGAVPPPPPEAFVRLVERHRNVRLWLSGHYHLSHNYSSSVSSVGGCAFAQVGVIGPRSTRDGLRQSRVLDSDVAGFELGTLDHETGQTRVDVRGAWDWERTSDGPLDFVPVPTEELLDPAADVAWLSSQVDCDASSASVPLGGGESPSSSSWPAPGSGSPSRGPAERTQWLPAGGDALLAFDPTKGEVLEYSARMRCPVGFVLDKLPTDKAGETRARLVDADGDEVYPNSSASSPPGDADAEAAASRAAAVEVVVSSTGQVVGRRGRNAKGSFYHVYQANKWRKKVSELESEERSSVAVV